LRIFKVIIYYSIKNFSFFTDEYPNKLAIIEQLITKHPDNPNNSRI